MCRRKVGKNWAYSGPAVVDMVGAILVMVGEMPMKAEIRCTTNPSLGGIRSTQGSSCCRSAAARSRLIVLCVCCFLPLFVLWFGLSCLLLVKDSLGLSKLYVFALQMEASCCIYWLIAIFCSRN